MATIADILMSRIPAEPVAPAPDDALFIVIEHEISRDIMHQITEPIPWKQARRKKYECINHYRHWHDYWQPETIGDVTFETPEIQALAADWRCFIVWVEDMQQLSQEHTVNFIRDHDWNMNDPVEYDDEPDFILSGNVDHMLMLGDNEPDDWDE